MARKKTETTLPAAAVVAAPAPPAVLDAPAADVPSLADYIASKERDDIVLTRVTYPGATSHVYPGRYSGIVVADGPLSAQYSDGRTE